MYFGLYPVRLDDTDLIFAKNMMFLLLEETVYGRSCLIFLFNFSVEFDLLFFDEMSL